MRIVDLAKSTLKSIIRPGDWVIDATAGNGHDTLFLRECVGNTGKVWAFDIQEHALQQTLIRLETAHASLGVKLIHAGHETLLNHIPEEAWSKIRAVMFNLGYLPGSNKSLITTERTTLPALEQAVKLLAHGGMLSIILYPGHPGGAEEAEAVLQWTTHLSEGYSVEHKKPEGKQLKRSPELVLIRKL